MGVWVKNAQDYHSGEFMSSAKADVNVEFFNLLM